jgi:hypothetical protein
MSGIFAGICFASPDAREVKRNPRGQAYVIEPRHDAWVVGDVAVVGFEFDSRTAEEYAKG